MIVYVPIRIHIRRSLSRRMESLRVLSVEPRGSDEMRKEHESSNHRAKWRKRRHAFRLGT